jgi:hypothetical protein
MAKDYSYLEGMRANCNNCATKTRCKGLVGATRRCSLYVPPENLQVPLLSYLLYKGQVDEVATLLHKAGLAFEEKEDYPFFRLISKKR